MRIFKSVFLALPLLLFGLGACGSSAMAADETCLGKVVAELGQAHPPRARKLLSLEQIQQGREALGKLALWYHRSEVKDAWHLADPRGRWFDDPSRPPLLNDEQRGFA